MGIEIGSRHDNVIPVLINQTIHMLKPDLDMQRPFELCIYTDPKIHHLSAKISLHIRKLKIGLINNKLAD